MFTTRYSSNYRRHKQVVPFEFSINHFIAMKLFHFSQWKALEVSSIFTDFLDRSLHRSRKIRNEIASDPSRCVIRIQRRWASVAPLLLFSPFLHLHAARSPAEQPRCKSCVNGPSGRVSWQFDTQGRRVRSVRFGCLVRRDSEAVSFGNSPFFRPYIRFSGSATVYRPVWSLLRYGKMSVANRERRRVTAA